MNFAFWADYPCDPSWPIERMPDTKAEAKIRAKVINERIRARDRLNEAKKAKR